MSLLKFEEMVLGGDMDVSPIRDMVKRSIDENFTDRLLKRRLSSVGAGLSAEWGSLKVTRSFIEHFDLPIWFAGLSNSTVALVYSILRETGVVEGSSAEELKVKLDVTEFAKLTDSSWITVSDSTTSKYGRSSLFGMIDGIGAVPELASKYDSMIDLVVQRDALAERLGAKLNGSDLFEDDEFGHNDFKQLEVITGHIIRSVENLETELASSMDVLIRGDIDLLETFLNKIKSGMVNAF